MAATIKGREIAGKLGKRLVTGAGAFAPSFLIATSSPSLRSSKRNVQTSSYDKNADEHEIPAVVPDHVLDTGASDKYWGPHPNTGVFGPSSDTNFATSSIGKTADGSSTVLDQKVWFRPLEDVEKPPHN